MKNLNSVPKTLTDEKKFKKVFKKVNNSSKDDMNKNKLRASNKKILNQTEEKFRKILKNVETLEKNSMNLKKTGYDPDARFMKNKKRTMGI